MKNKTVAVLLAFFFGALGIHKFYLGHNFAGIIYLVFFWTGIPAIIAFFEFLGLVLMSEQAFNGTYNAGLFSQASNPTINISRQSSRDTVATLADLKKLYDSGIITAEEYEVKRRKYLDNL